MKIVKLPTGKAHREIDVWKEPGNNLNEKKTFHVEDLQNINYIIRITHWINYNYNYNYNSKNSRSYFRKQFLTFLRKTFRQNDNLLSTTLKYEFESKAFLSNKRKLFQNSTNFNLEGNNSRSRQHENK